MDEMERFACTVPSAQAVKDTEITCYGTAPDNYEVVGTVSDWVLIILTALLVLGAFMAWFKAKQTLNHMIDDSKDADDRLLKDIQSRESHEYTQKLREAMFEYLSAHEELLSASTQSKEAVTTASRRVALGNLKFIFMLEPRVIPSGPRLFDQMMNSLPSYSLDAKTRHLSGSHSEHQRSYQVLTDKLRRFQRGDLDAPQLFTELESYVGQRVGDRPDIFQGLFEYFEETEWPA